MIMLYKEKPDPNTLDTPSTEHSSQLPENLRQSLEYLSNLDLSDVQIHYNSLKPIKVEAAAYACGTDIFLAPGTEQHLPHESWHVVQQKQGRVGSIATVNGESLNDDPELEKEADIMGKLAAAMSLALEAGYIDFFPDQDPEKQKLQTGEEQ
jgi:hypothetical protein